MLELQLLRSDVRASNSEYTLNLMAVDGVISGVAAFFYVSISNL